MSKEKAVKIRRTEVTQVYRRSQHRDQKTIGVSLAREIISDLKRTVEQLQKKLAESWRG